ncbi:MAG TPA: cobalt-precorrin-5B (C(1))-methyltransferase [Methanospirillum sp.]|nr:cobalt-precorrin-5B (C(1))-methyltransferase [Methanospirillum sp.]
MQDPVIGFDYPDSWVDACGDPASLEAVKAGLAVLTADGTVLKRGFTTGTTAAAAAKAAVLSLKHQVRDIVDIMTPAGIRVDVPGEGRSGEGICRKYSGDYPGDVTAGVCFFARAEWTDSGITITPGSGIGIWERENPRYPCGTPAISPPAYQEIVNAISEALYTCGMSGVAVSLTVQDGESIAEHTLNRKIGVIGGISVLGSTGFVEPWDEHLESSLIERVESSSRVVLTTGRVGLRFSRLLFPGHEVILAGSRLSPALEHAHGEVIIAGLPALILKFMNPLFLEGSGYGSIEEMIGTPEFERRSNDTLRLFCSEHPAVRVVLIDREGRIIRKAP